MRYSPVKLNADSNIFSYYYSGSLLKVSCGDSCRESLRTSSSEWIKKGVDLGGPGGVMKGSSKDVKHDL